MAPQRRETSDFEETLAAGQDQWASTSADAPAPPDGLYTLTLQSAKVFQTGGGKTLIRWEHLVMEGELKGETITDLSSLSTDNDTAIRMLKQRFNLLGEPFSLESPEMKADIPEYLALLVQNAPSYTAEVKTKQFTNVNIKRIVDADYLAPPGENGSGEEPDADEPPDADQPDELLQRLIELAQAHQIEVSEQDDVDAVTAKLCDGLEWSTDEVTPDELETLREIGATVVEPKPKPAPAPRPKPKPKARPKAAAKPKARPKAKPKGRRK